MKWRSAYLGIGNPASTRTLRHRNGHQRTEQRAIRDHTHRVFIFLQQTWYAKVSAKYQSQSRSLRLRRRYSTVLETLNCIRLHRCEIIIFYWSWIRIHLLFDIMATYFDVAVNNAMMAERHITRAIVNAVDPCCTRIRNCGGGRTKIIKSYATASWICGKYQEFCFKKRTEWNLG